MNASVLKNLMNMHLGGTDEYFRNRLNPRHVYTKGVQSVAVEAGAYWFLDIVATELVPLCLKEFETHGNSMMFVELNVLGPSATIVLMADKGEPPAWSREINYTDFPPGDWTFYMCVDGTFDQHRNVVVMCLPQEY